MKKSSYLETPSQKILPMKNLTLFIKNLKNFFESLIKESFTKFDRKSKYFYLL